MIAVDTSALMAILLNEAEADACIAALTEAEAIVISAGTMAETLIVARRRGVSSEATQLLDGLNLEILSVTPLVARRVANVHARWGKGIYPAALNFGDCFAYDAAEEHDCPLLFIGHDFSRTDIRSALLA